MRTLFFFLIIGLWACSGSSSVPQGVLPQEKMQAVLYDAIRADEMTDFLQTTDSTYRMFSKRTALYDTIFQLHKVKKEEFQKSMKYYQGRPDLLKEIFDDLQKKVTDTSQKRVLSAPQ